LPLKAQLFLHILAVMAEVLSAGYRLLRVPQALILVDLELFLVLIDALEHVAVDNLDFCRHKVV